MRAFDPIIKKVPAFLTAFAMLLGTLSALAAPEAHLMRIDPRAAQENGVPVLTTVLEVVQTKRITDATGGCIDDKGSGFYRCLADAMEKPYALYQPFPFPHENAIFTVRVDGSDQPASYVSDTKWGDSMQQPGVGTAWLIMVDADARIKHAFEDAKAVANQFIGSMGPNDIVNVMFFNDRQIVKDSKWMNAAKKASAQQFVGSVGATWPSAGRNRSLFTIIKDGATDGFKSLGNVGEDVNVPLHQAMVVISTGYGGVDALTTGAGGLQLAKYMSGGRFPEDNTALPKAPVPVISIWVPPTTYDEYRQSALEFMRGMANTEIGGFFSVVQKGEAGRAPNIVNSVRSRFAKMYIVKWRVSCIESSVTQTFSLVFNNVKPPILGDNSFKEVPVGIDPTTWPLDVNIQYSQDMNKRAGGVYRDGKFKVYGNFCWGGEKGRAEVYFLPAGQALPAALSGADVEKAKRTQQQLIAMGMKGTAVEVSDTYAEFQAPDKDKLVHGSGEAGVVRIVLYDNKAHRTSGVTSDSIVQLKGVDRPLPWIWILGGAFGFVIVMLLVVIMFRGGGNKRRGGGPPPQPPYGGGGYGPPPGGGYPPPGGGYGGPPPGGGYGGPPPGGGYPPPGGGYGGGGYGASPSPAGGAGMGAAPMGGSPMPAPAPAPAPLNPEFMYGAGPHPNVPAPAAPIAPPPNPYGGGTPATRATLQGAAGVFTIVPGVEMRAGRDGSQCGILLTEPRVSGLHATLKLENGGLLIRDEQSNNGTMVNGNRLPAGAWTPAPNGSLVRFGPVEFSVRLE
jgi:hypothetical protein